MKTTDLDAKELAGARLGGSARGDEGSPRDLYLVADRNLMIQRRRMHMERTGSPGGDRIPVKMMGGWIGELAIRMGIGLRRLQGWEQNALIRALVARIKPSPSGGLAGIWERRGTAESLARFVRETRAGELADAGELPGELRALLLAYEDLLAEYDLADGPRLFHVLARALREGEDEGFLWDRFTVEGFWHLDQPTIELLTAAFCRSRDPLLLLAWDGERPDLFPTTDELKRDLGDLESHVVAYDPDRNRSGLAGCIFHPAGWDPTTGPRTSAFRVSDDAEGVEELAARIKEEIRGGTPVHRCCVVYSSSARLRMGAKQLVRAGVPVDTAPAVTLGETGPGRVARALLRVLESPSAENLVDLVSGPYLGEWERLLRLTRFVPPQLEGEDIREHLATVKRSLRARTGGSGAIAWESTGTLGGWIDEISAMEGALSDLNRILDGVPERGSQPLVDGFLRALDTLGVPRGIREVLESDGGYGVDTLRDLDAWRKMSDGLRLSLGGLFGQTDPRCSRTIFSAAFEEMLAGVLVGEPATPDLLDRRPGAGRGVRLALPEELSGETYQIVAMPDISAGTYPGPVASSWIGRLVRDHPPDAESYREQNRRFYRAVRACEADLLLIHSAKSDGRTTTVSPYLQELAMENPESYEDLTGSRDRDRTPGTWTRMRLRLLGAVRGHNGLLEETLELAGETLERGRRERFPGPSSRSLPNPGARELARATAAESARWSREFGPWDGILGQSATSKVASHLARRGRLAVTGLDAYGRCPYRFFASHILGLDDGFRPEESLAAHRAGQLYHRVLERYYRDLIPLLALGEGDDARFGARREILEEILEEALAELREGLGWIGDVWWESVARRAISTLGDLLEAEDERRSRVPGRDMQPYRLEHRFEHPLGRLLGEAGVAVREDVKISGTIDRLDIWENPGGEERDRLMVFDYKLGTNPPKADTAERGGDAQMPLYLMAAGIENPDKDLLGGGYISVSGANWERGIYRPEALPILGLPESRAIPDMDALLAAAARHILRSWRGMNEGRFPMFPFDSGDCEYCPYPGLCRYSRDRIADKEYVPGAPRGEEANDE